MKDRERVGKEGSMMRRERESRKEEHGRLYNSQMHG